MYILHFVEHYIWSRCWWSCRKYGIDDVADCENEDAMWAEKNLAHVMQLGDGRGVRRCTKLGQSGHFFSSFFRFLAGQTRVCHRWLTDWPTFDFVIYDKPLVVRELSRRHTCQRSHVTFETFDQTKTKTMRPWQRRVTSETFVRSFEETWPDQKKTKTQTKTNSWQSLWPDN